jgi:hypothetical protein
MSAPFLRRLLGIFLALALGAATAGAGVAHRLSSGGPEEEALAVYLAMGGKLADLCGKGDPTTTHCDACRHIGPALPPLFASGAIADGWPFALVPAPRPGPRITAQFRPTPARGPPAPIV